MVTDISVQDGTLSNEQYGAFLRRIFEILERMKRRSLSFRFVMEGLQKVIDGPAVVLRDPEEKPVPFKRPPRAKRRTSLAAINRRLGGWKHRYKYPHRLPEHLIVEMWEAENIPSQGISFGRVPIHSILCLEDSDDEPNERDVEVANSTIQWLGTSSGQAFLSEFIRARNATY